MRTLYEGAYFSISSIKNEDINVLSHIFVILRKNAYFTRRCVLVREVTVRIMNPEVKCVLYTKVRTFQFIA